MEAQNQEIWGVWVPTDYVFPRRFVEELHAKGKITQKEGWAMLNARYNEGRITGRENLVDSIPEWALRKLQEWKVGK